MPLPSFDALLQTVEAWPHTTSAIQWVDHIVCKVDGKVFAIISLTETGYDGVAMKIDETEYDELIEQEGFFRPSHLANKKWIGINTGCHITVADFYTRVRYSYHTVLAGLSKKRQRELGLL